VLYLSVCCERDRLTGLDQSGETDPGRTTVLEEVFVDLDVKPIITTTSTPGYASAPGDPSRAKPGQSREAGGERYYDPDEVYSVTSVFLAVRIRESS
jgi:hypothetical protein